MTHSSGPWKYPTRQRASFSRARGFLIALVVASLALAIAHTATGAISNLAHFNANQEERQ